MIFKRAAYHLEFGAGSAPISHGTLYVSKYLCTTWRLKHVEGKDVAFPVNSIVFHPLYGTFATGGCDGFVNIWDGNNKKRLHQYPKYPTSVSALAFNASGTMLVVAASYTFEQGDKDHPPDALYVRAVHDGEVKPKAKMAR
ncbi:hypothetical protein CYMTET_6134 [Cymbomonas tetramitiformis]|uniref:Mitotic checkpoint protein n=1 Tax=Cymbomonas tetramitiformis TaxID=36881 RepID=A0AAE0LI78_9CHLO|nr:hypothetical protein CYMTET_6134 [Cymbomonas tetramitiformis]